MALVSSASSARPGRLVVSGSYEGGLHGWVVEDDASQDVPSLGLQFSFGAHTGCTRCVATNGAVGGGLLLSGVLTLATLALVFGNALPGGLFLPLIFCGACLGGALARLGAAKG